MIRRLGQTLKLCQLNIEGISRSKSDHLSRVLCENNVDLVLIQETHTINEEELQKRGKIHGYSMIGATYDSVYGVATYARNNLEHVHHITSSTEDNIHVVVVSVQDITITNVYKPPTVPWPSFVLPASNHPAIFAGDFNSHHENWSYAQSDICGTALVEWTEEHNLHLIFDAKDRGSFRSATWQREYNPDLCFVTSDNKGQPLPAVRRILGDFPRSQHRLVLVEIGLSIPLITSFPRPRWNFNKANWTKFTSELDKCIRWIPARSVCYNRFVGLVTSIAKKYIPRGYRKEYIPGWNEQSDVLYNEYMDTGNHEVAEELLRSLDASRKQKWTETVEKLNFQHSSRKAWSLLRKLGGSCLGQREQSCITPNKIASHIVSTSKVSQDKDYTRMLKRNFKKMKASLPTTSPYSKVFTLEEVNVAIEDLKHGKAPGFDGIHPEFLLNLGQNARKWLARFFSDILNTGILPTHFKKTKIIAVLKPGKPKDAPQSYRPIALLSCCYKLLERLIYNRISPTILEHIPVEQAGFRPNRSCCDQVLALTSYIESGFQLQLKTSVVFLDLSAAYDTVWREGLLYKLSSVVPCRTIIHLIGNMLSNRLFQVVLGKGMSKQKKLNNGLPQGSVLAPLLFNLYLSDLPETQSRKFCYADDIAVAIRHKDISVMENVLNDDLARLERYFHKWRLQPSATKTEVSCFHLNTRMADRAVHVSLQGSVLRYNKHPKYLGVTLDRTLSFKKHLENTAAKIRSRNNILQKLCGTTWGASAITLRCSALGLVFSTAEYCAPVWLNSPHVKIIDTQLNNTMRLISGLIRPTPTYWLPVLSNIMPPDLRRKVALIREYKKIMSNPALPIHCDIRDLNRNRLKSRHPPIQYARALTENHFEPNIQWRNEWSTNINLQAWSDLIGNSPAPGFDLPRRTWTTLNRIRTNHGICAESLFKWGKIPSPQCDCGAPSQSVHHLAFECDRRAYQGNPSDFLLATPASLEWIKNLDVKI